MLENLATGDIFRIFTVLEQVSTDIKIKVMKVKELSIWDSNDTVTKDVRFDRVTMLEPTARNMHMLMLKINELVGVINELK